MRRVRAMELGAALAEERLMKRGPTSRTSSIERTSSPVYACQAKPLSCEDARAFWTMANLRITQYGRKSRTCIA